MTLSSGHRIGRFRLPLLFLLFVGLLCSRRSAQFVSPQVWCEEGDLIVGFMEHGWSAFLQPVSGYLILIPKIIVRTSLAVSLYYYPVVSTILAWTVIALVGLTIAEAPTHLSGRLVCAVAVFLIPSDPEVFGTTLYTFWWTTLCLFLLMLWDEERPCAWLRLGLLVGCGLSSPLILSALPVFYFRAIRYRAFHWEKVIAAVGTVMGAIQAHFLVQSGSTLSSSPASIFEHTIPKFCGWFVLGNLSAEPVLLWTSGILIVGLIGAYCFLERRQPMAWILVYAWGQSIAASVVRVDPGILHPSQGGPRYFFFPFALTAWVLIQILSNAPSRWLRGIAGTVLLMSFLNALPVWSRQHDDLQWREHVRSARLFPQYDVPIEFDGNRLNAWSSAAPGATWDRYLRQDRLISIEHVDALPTFAYRRVSTADETVEPKPIPRAGIAARSSPRRKRGPVMSYRPAASGKPEALIELERGDRLRFRSDASPLPHAMRIEGRESSFISELPVARGWQTLEFSNSKLPAKFTLIIPDEGEGTGDWGLN